MCLVLLELIWRLLLLDHCWMDLISSPSSCFWVGSFIFVHGVRSVLSSEYLTIEQLSCLARRSSVNIEKMLGRPTVP